MAALSTAEKEGCDQDEEDAMSDAVKLLLAASHALRSYQYGNSSPDLGREIADEIDAFLLSSLVSDRRADEALEFRTHGAPFRKYLSSIGRKGGKVTGVPKGTAAIDSPEERSRRAKAAAEARWGKKKPAKKTSAKAAKKK